MGLANRGLSRAIAYRQFPMCLPVGRCLSPRQIVPQWTVWPGTIVTLLNVESFVVISRHDPRAIWVPISTADAVLTLPSHNASFCSQPRVYSFIRLPKIIEKAQLLTHITTLIAINFMRGQSQT